MDVHVKCEATGDVMLRVGSAALHGKMLLSSVVFWVRSAGLQRSPKSVQITDNLIENID